MGLVLIQILKTTTITFRWCSGGSLPEIHIVNMKDDMTPPPPVPPSLFLPFPYNQSCPSCRIPPPIQGQWILKDEQSQLNNNIIMCCAWDGTDQRYNHPHLHPNNENNNDMDGDTHDNNTDSRRKTALFQCDEQGIQHVVTPLSHKYPHRNQVYTYSQQKSVVAPTGGNACVCQHDFVNAYRWQPSSSSTSLPSSFFDAHRTCQLLGNRTTLLIGDSTMHQVAPAIMNALLSCNDNDHHHHHNHNMVFVLSDTLDGKNYGRDDRGLTLHEALVEYEPDIVIYGVGAHIYGEEHFVTIFETVLAQLQDYATLRPHVRYAYKTQQPGGCTETMLYPHPYQAVQELNVTGQYNYDTFYARDDYAVARLSSSLEGGGAILDLRMMYSRTEAHVGTRVNSVIDCLHYCAGPLEEIVPTLFQQLLETDFGRHIDKV